LSSSSPRDLLIEGVNGVYKWSLANLISSIVLIVGAVVAIAAGVSTMSVLAALVSIGIAFVIGFIIGLFALYFLYTGFRNLRDYDRHVFGTGFTGVKLIIAALILVIVGIGIAIAAALSAAGHTITLPMGSSPAEVIRAVGPAIGGLLAGGALIIVAGILALIGIIMVAIGLWRLGDVARDGTLIKIGAVLLVIAVILMIFRVGGILDLVATVLILIGAKRMLNELRTSAQPGASQVGVSTSPPPPPS